MLKEITIVLVTYNHEPWIARALESISEQKTSHRLSVLVADDCSNDMTVNLIKDWADANPSIPVTFLTNDSNLGITKNYFRAFQSVTGDYAAVLEGDDFWLASDKIERQVDLLEKNFALSMSFTRVVSYFENSGASQIENVFIPAAFDEIVSRQSVALNNLIGNFSACLYRVSALKKIRPEICDLVAYDWAYNLEIMSYGPAGFVPLTGGAYRKHNRGAWSSLSDRNKISQTLDLIGGYQDFFGPSLFQELESYRVRAMNELGVASSYITRTKRHATVPSEPARFTCAPLVSVVMTSYMHSLFIAESIRSVLNQSFSDFELIIVDDASSDDSWNVISILANSNQRIRSFRLAENQGGASALNFAIQESRGELIAVINSDDTWEKDKLQKQVDFLKRNQDITAVFTSAEFTNENGVALKGKDAPDYVDVFNKKNRSAGKWLRALFDEGNFFCHPSVLIRRKFFMEFGLYDNRLRQLPDFEMWVRLVKFGKIHVMNNFKGVRFRILNDGANASSVTPANSARSHSEHVQIMRTFFSNCSQEIFIDGFADLFRNPKLRLSKLVEMEKALVLFKAAEPVTQIAFEAGLDNMQGLLGKVESKILLASHFGFKETDLHFLNSRFVYSHLEGNPITLPARELIKALLRKTRLVPLRSLPRQTLRVLFPNIF